MTRQCWLILSDLEAIKQCLKIILLNNVGDAKVRGLSKMLLRVGFEQQDTVGLI